MWCVTRFLSLSRPCLTLLHYPDFTLRSLYRMKRLGTSEVFLNKIPGRASWSSGDYSNHPIFVIKNRYIILNEVAGHKLSFSKPFITIHILVNITRPGQNHMSRPGLFPFPFIYLLFLYFWLAGLLPSVRFNSTDTYSPF